MSKFGRFLNEQSLISNKDRGIAFVGVLALGTISEVLLYKLLKERQKSTDKDLAIAMLSLSLALERAANKSDGTK